jgi:hypothetical protein
MKKKILAIVLVGTFLMVVFTNVNASSFKLTKKVNQVNLKNELSGGTLLAEADLFIGEHAVPNALIILGSTTQPAGDYTCKYEINYDRLLYDSRAVGHWWVYAYVGNIIFFEENVVEFDYSGDNVPEDIEVEITRYVPNTGFAVGINVGIGIGYYYDLYDALGGHIKHIDGEDRDDYIFYFPKEKILNDPLFKVLRQHPILYQVSRRILEF